MLNSFFRLNIYIYIYIYIYIHSNIEIAKGVNTHSSTQKNSPKYF